MNPSGRTRWWARAVRPVLVVAVLVGGLGPGAAAGDFRATEVQMETNPTRLGFGDDAPAEESSIVFSGFETNIADVDVFLLNVSHANSPDMDVVLQGPGGQTAIIMSDAGSGATTSPDVTLGLSDRASTQLPSTSALRTGAFQATNFGSGDTIQKANGQAFTPPSGSALGVFTGTNPNGTWTLYAFDDTGNGSTGFILGGWSLRITSANGVPQAQRDSFTAKAGRKLTVRAPGVLKNDTDPDGDLLTAVVADRPNKGRLVLRTDGSFTYTPRRDAKGKDSFTYLVRDFSGLTDTAKVTIQIKGKKGRR